MFFEVKNLWQFSEGSLVRSVYSGIVYQVVRHTKNGMCVVKRLDINTEECWNAFNNAHFIFADFITLGVRSLL